MEKTKIILDCDPGHDDAVAIMMAAKHPALDLLAITTVSGNQTLDHTQENARNVCQYLGLDIPVYAGCPGPMIRNRLTAGDIHGKSGLDGPVFEPLVKPLEKEHAVAFLCRKLMESDGDITLVITGPMTNVAMAMRMEPGIIPKIRQIVFMGGAYTNGNITPAAEFNIAADGDAAYVVFNSGVPLTMCGLDITRKVLCYPAIVERMEKDGNKAAHLFADLMRFFCRTQKEVFGWEGGPLHDPTTIAYLIDPDVLTLRYVHGSVDIRSTESYGRTNCDLFGYMKLEPNMHVATDIDVEKFWDIVESCIRNYD